MRRKKTIMVNGTTIKMALDEFYAEKKALNLSNNTIDTYKLHINRFVDFNGLEIVKTDFIQQDLYYAFIDYLQDEETKDVTIASYCRSIRAFIYWLQDKEYCERFDLQIPKFQKTVKNCYTNDEMKILMTFDNDFSEVEYQTYVFICLVFSHGIRLSSALNILVSDYNSKDKTININKTKNNNALVLNISNELKNILDKYIRIFNLKNNDFLFCTANNTQLAKRTIQDNVATYNRKHGIQKTSIHLMRHTFARNYYLKTHDIYKLMRLLDHSDISTTQNYIKDLGIQLDSIEDYNPLELVTQTKKHRRGKIKK